MSSKMVNLLARLGCALRRRLTHKRVNAASMQRRMPRSHRALADMRHCLTLWGVRRWSRGKERGGMRVVEGSMGRGRGLNM